MGRGSTPEVPALDEKQLAIGGYCRRNAPDTRPVLQWIVLHLCTHSQHEVDSIVIFAYFLKREHMKLGG